MIYFFNPFNFFLIFLNSSRESDGKIYLSKSDLKYSISNNNNIFLNLFMYHVTMFSPCSNFHVLESHKKMVPVSPSAGIISEPFRLCDLIEINYGKLFALWGAETLCRWELSEKRVGHPASISCGKCSLACTLSFYKPSCASQWGEDIINERRRCFNPLCIFLFSSMKRGVGAGNYFYQK